MKQVNWSAYARKYDIITCINPAYLKIVEHCVATVAGWPLQAGDIVADIGGGTGNFSIALAHALPAVTFLHTDYNEDMLMIARTKAKRARLKNWRAVQMDVQQQDWSLPALAGIVAVHCLFSFKDPQHVIQKMSFHLKPAGFVYACDIGRVLNIWDWTVYLLGESLRQRGFKAMLSLFLHAQDIRRQSRALAGSQKRGVYWTHNLAEFRASFEGAGIEVLSVSDALFRGYDDLVVGRKSHG